MKRFLLLLLLCGPVPAAAAGPQVAVSIKPIHSLVSSLMQGIAEPVLIVSAAGSPHGYNLRPSDARALHRADLVVWIGPDLESFMSKSVMALQPESRVLALMTDLPNLVRLPSRTGGEWSGEDDHRHEHGSGRSDPHIWLSPDNARVIVEAVTRRLIALDPDRSGLYTGNRDDLLERLDALDHRLTTRLDPVRGRNYLVFHDAYQYFEHYYGLRPVGALAIDPDRRPGARRLAELKQSVRDRDVACIFAEPQFEPRLIRVLTEGTTVKTGILDPLGADLPPGPGLYFDLLEQMAGSLAACLMPDP